MPFSPTPPEAALRTLVDTAAAEAAGDPVEALRVHQSFAPFAHSPHSRLLRTLVELEDTAPGWLWSRWMTVQAHRGDMSEEPEAPEPALPRAIEAAYVHGVELSPELPPEAFAASVFQCDWIVRQLRVYDGGELSRLVDHRAGPPLLERSDHIHEWIDAPMRGLQLVGWFGGPSLHFTDLATGEHLELLDLGLLCEHELGTSFIGRVVPTSLEPGRMWEWRPLRVDEPTAREVAALAGEPDVWVSALARAHRERRLSGMYSWHDDMTPMSDVSCMSFLALVPERQRASIGQAADGLADLEGAATTACANALREVNGDREAAEAIWPFVAAALVWPGVLDHAKRTLARPQLADAWTAIAATLPEPARGRAQQLADAAHRRRAA